VTIEATAPAAGRAFNAVVAALEGTEGGAISASGLCGRDAALPADVPPTSRRPPFTPLKKVSGYNGRRLHR
jgi:hypothetical protein